MTGSFMSIATEMTRAIIPVIIAVGVIGNTLNITVLTRPALCRTAYSHYFLVHSINNLFYSSVYLVYRLLVDGYQIDPATHSLIFCKLFYYFTQVCTSMSPHFIVLASIDRFCASSMNVRLRKFTRVRVARWAILCVVIMSFLYFISTPVIIDVKPDGLGCLIRGTTLFNQIYVLIQLLIFSLIDPCLMGLFGLLTIHNIKKVRIIPVGSSAHSRSEYQLIRMLLLQVCTYLVVSLPICVCYLIMALPFGYQPTPVYYSLFKIFRLLLHFSCMMPFFLNVLSGRVYRTELIRLMSKIQRFCFRAQIQSPRTTNPNQPNLR